MAKRATLFGLPAEELNRIMAIARDVKVKEQPLPDAAFNAWACKQSAEDEVSLDAVLEWRGHSGLSYRQFLRACWDRQIGSLSELLIRRVYQRQASGEGARLPGASATSGAGAAKGESPPTDNMGGTEREQSYVQLVMTDTGEVKQVPLRRGWGGDTAFIDWVNITVHADTCLNMGFQPISEDDHVLALSGELERIFGYVVTRRRPKGANHYKMSYDLGEETGAMVCIGGQRGTILISMSGKSLMMAKPGWEQRLHDWLVNVAVQPRITRVDLAHDVLDGDYYDVDTAFLDYLGGQYSLTNRRPTCEMRGNWLEPDGKGRTFYVGRRANGKFCRIYEKGKQLGSKNSSWVRIECELKSVDRVIPFDVLLKAGEYLGGAMPAFAFIAERQIRINTIREEAICTVEKAKANVKKQYGRWIWFISQTEGVEKALEVLGIPEMPKNFDPARDWRDQPTTTFMDYEVRLPAEALLDRVFP